MLGKGFNFVLPIGSNHDQIDHAADHSGAVFNGFCTPQLAVASCEVHHRASHLVHACFKAHTCSCGGFLKDHGQCAVCQWLVFFVGLELGFDERCTLENMRIFFSV